MNNYKILNSQLTTTTLHFTKETLITDDNNLEEFHCKVFVMEIQIIKNSFSPTSLLRIKISHKNGHFHVKWNSTKDTGHTLFAAV